MKLMKLFNALNNSFYLRKYRSFSRIFKNIFKEKFCDFMPLWYVEFSPDYECNLSCDHCFTKGLKDDKRKKMKIEDYKKVAEECMELGCVNFSFQGGEPLLCNDLLDIIKACSPNKNIITVTTNGVLLDKNKLKKLKESGVDIITFSIDSFISAEHNKFRGNVEIFDKVINNLFLAKKMGFNIFINTVVTHININSEGITSLIQFAEKNKICLFLLMPAQAGKWRDNKDIMLTEEDFNYICSLSDNKSFVYTDLQANSKEFGCTALKKNIYITPYGDILPCPFMHIKIGNVFNDSIKIKREQALQKKCFSKYNNKCLISNDEEFISKYLKKTFDAEKLPVSHKEIFNDS